VQRNGGSMSATSGKAGGLTKVERPKAAWPCGRYFDASTQFLRHWFAFAHIQIALASPLHSFVLFVSLPRPAAGNLHTPSSANANP
jgi:hypothetical protein